MLDQWAMEINSILGYTVAGVSIATIIGTVIALVQSIVKLRRENKLTKQYIEEAFNNAVFPKTVKLDLSKKIEEPLKKGFDEIQSLLENTLQRLERGEQLILSVLNEFSHVKKLPDEVKEEIQEYIDSGETTVIKLEE